MYLKEIVINGFKSFPEKTTVKINGELTAIVGPNGSGKSNISDAFKWVMGEQSAKILRGSKMEDVIFAGTEKRNPLSYAQVDLIFDNSTKKLPIEYKEVCITRKLFRSGESEYLLNQSSVKLKEIKELFMDTGIGIDGYSIIGQGRVEDIISAKSETRRKVIEEAAGIVKFKTRKEEAQKNLDKTDDNLERVNDIIDEIEGRINPLKRQKEAAEKYLQLREELKKSELNLFARDYAKLKEQLTLFKDHLEVKTQEVLKKENLIDDYQLKYEDAVEKTNALDEEKTSVEENLSSKNILLLELDHKITLDTERKNLLIAEKEKIQSQIDSDQEMLTQLQGQIDQFLESQKSKEDIYRQYQEKYREGEVKLNESTSHSDDAQNEIETKRNEIFELYGQQTHLNSRINTLDSLLENCQERINVLATDVERLIKEKKQISSEILIIEEELKKNDLDKENISNQFIETNQALINLKEDLKTFSWKANETSNRISEFSSKKNLLEKMQDSYEGYFKSIQQFMTLIQKRGLFKSEVLGIVAEIISTDKQFETALEIALGSSMQNIVVDQEKQVSPIIAFLKSNNIGRITFLPLDTIKGKHLNENEKKFTNWPGFVGVLKDLVKYEEKYTGVVDFLLGRIIVADNIQNAIKIAKSISYTTRIVTIDGEVINAGGAITGGTIKKSGINLMGRNREIKELQKKIDNERINHDHASLTIEKLQAQISDLDQNAIIIKGKLEASNDFYRDRTAALKYKIGEVENLEQQIKKTEESQSFLIAEKEKYHDEKLDIFKKSEALAILSKDKEDEIDLISQQFKASLSHLETLKNSIVEMKISLSEIKNELGNIEIQLDSKGEEKNNLINQINDNSFSLVEISERVKALDENAKQNQERIKDTNGQITGIKNLLADIIQQKKIKQEEMQEFQKMLHLSNKELNELYQDKNVIQSKIELTENRIESISAALWEEYEMSYAMCMDYIDESVSVTKLNNDVRNHKKNIKALGDVNVGAIAEYKSVSERHAFLVKQRDDLDLAKNKLNKVIKELTIEMKNQFEERFEKIRNQFVEVFVDLFNGGKADIVLMDENDSLNSDIEIYVQPPGKRLNKISLLSGGEKTLTAIALLFAILKTNPTPFCILDEIEAALDDSNVHRFAKYLKNFSQHTQFLVITHRKGTMEYVDTIYGATMEEHGVTKLISLKLSNYKI